MQTLEILIDANALGEVRPVEVIATVPVSALVPALVEELNLPQTDFNGNKLVYMLRHASGGRVLPDDKSLLASGVRNGATLTLDSYAMNGSVATLMQQKQGSYQNQAGDGLYASATLADYDDFQLPATVQDRHTSSSMRALRRNKGKGKWTRRSFLILGGAVVGLGSVGLGLAAYHSIFNGNVALQKQANNNPAATQPTQPPVTKAIIPATAQSIFTFTQHTQQVRSVAWSPDGKLIASGADDNQLLIWDMQGNVMAKVPLQAPVRSVAWSPDSQRLIVSAGKQVTFLNAMNGTVLAQNNHLHAAEITGVAWSAKQPQWAASGGLDNLAIAWDTTTYRSQTIFKLHTAHVEGVSFASDGQTIASASHGGLVRVWNAANGQEVHGYYQPTKNPLRTIGFAPTGSSLATAGDDGIVWLWNGLTCQVQKQSNFGMQCTDAPQLLQTDKKPMHTLAWSPDTRFLATGGDNGLLTVWYPGQKQTPLLTAQQNGQILALAWSPDGLHIASASGNTVTIWQLM